MKQNVNVRIETEILQIVNKHGQVQGLYELCTCYFFIDPDRVRTVCLCVNKSVDNPVEKPVNREEPVEK